jgi:hypothetical protein
VFFTLVGWVVGDTTLGTRIKSPRPFILLFVEKIPGFNSLHAKPEEFM